jgi:putative endopeptidase
VIKLKFFLCIVLLFLNPILSAKELERKDLLEGLKIPDRREFSESKTIGACENFHKHVCSEIESNFKLPDDRSIWYFSFSDNSEKILHAKKMFFKKVSEGFNPKGKRIQQVKNFYLACMNETGSAQSEIKYVSDIKNKISQIKTNQHYQKYLGSQIDKADFSGISFGTIPNMNNPKLNDLYLLPNFMTLPERSYYENQNIVSDLKKTIEIFFKSINLEDPNKRAARVLDFESKMAKVFPTPLQFRDLLTSNTYQSKENFFKKYKHLALHQFLNKIPNNTQLRDLAPEALAQLDQLMLESDLATLQSVFLYHSLREVMDDAYPEYQKQVFAFNNKHLGGPQERPPRDERCTSLASTGFTFEVDEYLTPLLFPNFPREKVIKMVSQVRNSLLEKLEKNTWISESAKLEASKKMKTATLFLVQPLTESEWDFNPLMTYSASDSVKNILKLKLVKNKKMLVELKKERKRERWGRGPLELNAYYSPPDNQFVLLQGILQYPFFDPLQSEIENLGAIGSVIGHELGHGIDDNGSKFDSLGQLRQWMTEGDLNEFKKRGEKFVNQFEGVGHNGKLTLGENIGDHVGINSSYSAVLNHFPNLTTEDKQKFFKSYARIWCNVSRPEYEKTLLKMDVHSLGRERINQQVVHVNGFYEAFSCKKGDKMYLPPEGRASIW